MNFQKVIWWHFKVWFGLMLNILVNSYGHDKMVSSPNVLTTLFSWTSLNKQLTSTSCTYFLLLIDINPSWISGREDNGHRIYFMINLNLQESMGPAGIVLASQTHICSQTHYRMHYTARLNFKSISMKVFRIIPEMRPIKFDHQWAEISLPSWELRTQLLWLRV